MAKKLGADACVCLNTSGNSSTWIPMIAARNIKAMRPPGGMVDTSDRSSSFGSVIANGRYAPSIEFDMIANGGAAMTALRTAFVNGTPIHVAYLEGAPGTSARGMRGDWAVCGFPLEFPLTDGQKFKCVLKPHANFTYGFDLNYTDGLGLGTPETAVSKRLGTKASINDSTHAPITAAQDIKWVLEHGAMPDGNDRLGHLSGDGNTYFIDAVLPTRKKFTVEFSIILNRSDAQVAALLTAYFSATGPTPIQLWALDGPYATSGSWGVTGDFCITDFPMDAELLGPQKCDLKLEPHGNATNLPAFVTI